MFIAQIVLNWCFYIHILLQAKLHVLLLLLSLLLLFSLNYYVFPLFLSLFVHKQQLTPKLCYLGCCTMSQIERVVIISIILFSIVYVFVSPFFCTGTVCIIIDCCCCSHKLWTECNENCEAQAAGWAFGVKVLEAVMNPEKLPWTWTHGMLQNMQLLNHNNILWIVYQDILTCMHENALMF